MTAGAVIARARFGTVRAALEPMTGLPSPPRRTRDCPARTVERLMKTMGLQGVVRGKKVVTTNPDTAQPCPDDKVNRAFKADMPNQLWVSDFTYVSSWQGMVYVAFVIDVFARKIVGWRVSTSMTTGFVLDALNQAICQRAPSEADKLIHHSDRSSQGVFNRLSQHPELGGVDDDRKPKIQTIHAAQIVLARTAAHLAA
jgi:putative transposase